MRPQVRVVLALLVFAGGGVWAYGHFGAAPEPAVLTGYVEAAPLHLAAPVAGALRALSVSRGERVEAGAALFALDPGPIAAQRRQAEAALAAAEARAADARAGQRPAELAVIAARRTAAEAGRDEAEGALERVRHLVARDSLPTARLDEAEAAFAVAAAGVEQAAREYEAAGLGARDQLVLAAEAEIARARAALEEVELRLAELAPLAPVAGLVDDTWFAEGEWVGAGQPVLSILPEDAVTIRFFVPGTALALYAPGTSVTFDCDACPGPQRARIAFVAPRPEFTPPVIYSRGSREKLVWMVEAVPEAPESLRPGQPVDIHPLEP